MDSVRRVLRGYGYDVSTVQQRDNNGTLSSDGYFEDNLNGLRELWRTGLVEGGGVGGTNGADIGKRMVDLIHVDFEGEGTDIADVLLGTVPAAPTAPDPSDTDTTDALSTDAEVGNDVHLLDVSSLILLDASSAVDNS